MVNFIKHFRGSMDRFAEDDRFTSFHISLYFALFHFWNRNRFKNPISISREELMNLSRIGSVNTYQKCMKELNEWGYIIYMPSFSPSKGSKIHMFRYDIAINKARGKAASKGAGNEYHLSGKKQVIPSINNPNVSNTLNNKTDEQSTKNLFDDFIKSPGKEKNKSANSRKLHGGRPAAVPISIEEAEQYFIEQKSNALEAGIFFNHFQSNGWKVGGQIKITDWKAAARKWMLNAKKYAKQSAKLKPGQLNASTDKNYAEPL